MGALALLGLLAVALGVSSQISEIRISPDVQAIARKYSNGFGPAAEAELRTLSKVGDASASALLGELLGMPDRVGGPDYANACNYSERAGEYSSALHNLATCYFLGNGRPKDMTKARDLYHQAAELGFPKAKCAFGNMLVRGDGGPADPKTGVELCRQAADAGLPDAQTDYAGYLLTGEFIPKDAVSARQYLLPAAEKGQANAAFLLAQIYWNGDGIEKDVSQAAIWWITSYKGGRKDAAFRIGMAAFNLVVEGAKKDRKVPTAAIDQGKKWLAIAADQDPDSKKREDAREGLRLLNELVGEH